MQQMQVLRVGAHQYWVSQGNLHHTGEIKCLKYDLQVIAQKNIGGEILILKQIGKRQ